MTDQTTTTARNYIVIAVLSGNLLLSGCSTMSDTFMGPTSRPAIERDLPPRDTSADGLGERHAEPACDPLVEDNVIWGY